ncbi:uncharacterized protein LOC129742340 [Uranotaenia lowii]|uniref:uncharacterized protein LOC129742340 n=1 Tax=Uranotaenia lowii TaxID=190385 RepID=UPI002478FBC1|nr:uncharacterized protein LOC129742340 [Uranotaenia lowii]
MFSDGKYVRAPSNDSEGSTNESLENLAEGSISLSYSSMEASPSPEASPKKGGETMSNETSRNFDFHQKLDRFGEELNRLERAFNSIQQYPTRTAPNDVDRSWNIANNSTKSTNIIRWESIQPFPNDVPASKMWEQWIRFIDRFEIAASLYNANDTIQRSQLLFLAMGEKLQGIVRAARLRPNLQEPNCYSIFIKNIEDYLRSMIDITAEHESFSNMKQEQDEPTMAFHARLMEKVRLCGYSCSDQDRFVRTQLLKGMRSRTLAKESRIHEYNATKIVQLATREEALPSEGTHTETQQAFAVDNRKQRMPERRGAMKRSYNATAEPFNSTKQRRYGQGRRSRCPQCNFLFHKHGKCPAANENCKGCGMRGHYVATCHQKKKHANNVQTKIPGWTDSEDEKKQSPCPDINSLTLSDVLIDCRLGSSSPIRFLIDSGADVNIIGGDDWKRLKNDYFAGKALLKPIRLGTNADLRSYASSKPISIRCSFNAQVEVVGHCKPLVEANFLVADAGRRSLLGRATASDLELLKVGACINACETYQQAKTFPKVPGVRIKFSVDKSVSPTKNAYFNVPAAFRESARARLEEMEHQGIIERVTTAPDWISGMSAVAKGRNDFRLVVNMRAPNRAIKREYYRMPLLDDMKIKLHGSKYFSKLDISNAFYHLELHENSRDLTTFLTETGMFRFTRLMFGVNCAPEIFQREMSRILEEVENKIVFIDDILAFSDSLEELHKTVALILRILRSNNLTINASKCEYDKTRIKFLGHELDEHGFHIDEAKVAAIRKFRKPSTVSELRSFLGLASYVSPYIRNFADTASPLWAIISSPSWIWGDAQTEAFELLKDQISNCTVSLGYFSEKAKTILYTDASPSALGAVLVQEDAIQQPPRVIYFASKALTDTEKRYPQNQREALGAVWAVEHFAYFLLGRQFTLRTDAQGFTFMLNRSREASKRALTRADGWALRLSPYNFNVEYVRGQDNIADPSSWLYEGQDEPFEENTSPWEIATLEANSIKFITEDEIRKATASDKLLVEVVVLLRHPDEVEDFAMHARDVQRIANPVVVISSYCAAFPETGQCFLVWIPPPHDVCPPRSASSLDSFPVPIGRNCFFLADTGRKGFGLIVCHSNKQRLGSRCASSTTLLSIYAGKDRTTKF